MFSAAPSVRIRPSPFYQATQADGLVSATIYNQMVLPTGYGDPEAEYWRLIKGVAQWDVGAERQVQFKGPDAARLAQILSPRDFSNCKVGQGKYAPLCSHNGVLINDPILLKLADDLYWLSIADSDIWLWSHAIAAERGLDVEITEPDVSPMALQGPKAEDVVAHVMGDWVRDIKYFWFLEAVIEGIPIAVQRSGWSKQGGFEIYLRDGSKGTQLWNIFKEAGQKWDIGPGTPNPSERTESGLLSVRADTDETTNPFELGLGKYINLDVQDDVIGIQALRQISEEGQKRHQLGIILEGDTPEPMGAIWEELRQRDRAVGQMTNCVWSYRLKKNIGYALVSVDVASGDDVTAIRSDGQVSGKLVDMPFV
ncbi:glycine cleavage T C-terminal barrel domain-containing protein [Parasulfitobacter algicola]|uniref:Glycine cleavage system protein T n=1 Tax=Parasulfitobacter algicola TaxID=2614809 RepID=A0ABX2IVD7_9RHOB|nr:glycine cleavage T C-terminal barrel domain-containing protein [Sulfitobacter algicola]NSX56270.1 glycine cleavage system protein T [Sulfitobacter algicola]